MDLLKAMQEMMAGVKAGQAKAEAERKADRKWPQWQAWSAKSKAQREWNPEWLSGSTSQYIYIY
jgi:hypothetical protein